MSTYWGYYCRTCSEESEHWHNRGEELLSEFYEARNAVRALQPIWVTVSTISQWADLDMLIFLDDHEGHDIALHNEYGEIADLPSRRAPNPSP